MFVQLPSLMDENSAKLQASNVLKRFLNYSNTLHIKYLPIISEKYFMF